MSAQGFTLFPTAVGWCGIAWNSRDGVAGVQLPERNESATRARLQRRFPQASEMPPPLRIRPTIERMTGLLNGEGGDLSATVLDMDAIPPRQREIYAIARGIPAGATLTYGEIAARLGGGDAREVGEAMARNPFPIIVPCHRVLAAGGKLGGFSASGGVVTKLRLLEIEGAQVGEAPTLFASLPLRARPRRR